MLDDLSPSIAQPCATSGRRICIDIRNNRNILINVKSILIFILKSILLMVLIRLSMLNGYASAAGPFSPPMLFVIAYQ